MNLTLYNFQVIKLVYECRSVTVAADKLFISQSAASHQLKLLNEYFGTPLFERSGRNIVPTEVGHLVYKRALNILSEFHELQKSIEELGKGEFGDVIVGGSLVVGTYMLPKIIGKFKGRYPMSNFKLHVLETSELAREITSGNVFFGLALSKIETAQLTCRKITEEEVVIVASSGCPESELPETIEELADKPFVISPTNMLGRKAYEDILSACGIEYSNIVMEVEHPEVIKQLVRQGLGLSILIRSAVEQDIRLGQLREVGLRNVKMKADIYLVYRRNRSFTSIENKFIDFVETKYSDGTAE